MMIRTGVSFAWKDARKRNPSNASVTVCLQNIILLLTPLFHVQIMISYRNVNINRGVVNGDIMVFWMLAFFMLHSLSIQGGRKYLHIPYANVMCFLWGAIQLIISLNIFPSIPITTGCRRGSCK